MKIIKKYFKKIGYEIKKIPIYERYFKNYQYFNNLYNSISHIEGDIVECGVGKGRSFLTLVSLSKEENKNRIVWGFDSFEGFPEPSEEDKSERNPKKGEWNVSSIESIMDYLIKIGKVDIDYINNNVRLVKGFFENSLKIFPNKEIALLHLDVDLYNSYKTCLESLYNKVADGGIILFDEYRNQKAYKKFPGASKAIDDFFSKIRHYIRYDIKADRYYIYKQEKSI